jgi:hypothetical protein
MSLLDQLKHVLSQYTSDTASPQDADKHFQQVAQAADPDACAGHRGRDAFRQDAPVPGMSFAPLLIPDLWRFPGSNQGLSKPRRSLGFPFFVSVPPHSL